MAYRIGFGVDYHQLVKGRGLWIGGVLIPHSHGALGHSDADVLLHSICDGLLGALSLGDIGTHFPNNDAAFKDADSKILLSKTFEMIQLKEYAVVNIDSTVCLEKPPIMGYSVQMRTVISNLLGIEMDAISIKATTTEKLGFVGRQEGLSAYATVLLEKRSG